MRLRLQLYVPACRRQRVCRILQENPGRDAMTVLRVFTAALAIAVLATSASMAGAQSWPTRPVTVVSPFTAGNASDLIGRITLEQVAKQVALRDREPPRRGRHGWRQSGRQGRS